jgi:hypothetical protein
MSDNSTFGFRDLITNGDRGRIMFVDTVTLINFDRIGQLDKLLDANRTIIITPEVQKEAVLDGYSSGSPGAQASAGRIDLWLQSHSGDVKVMASEPNRMQFAGKDAGDNSIRADVAYLNRNGDAIVVSDDAGLATKPIAGSDTPVLTGNYYLNALLVGGGITPSDYFQIAAAWKTGGFSQKVMPGDSDPLIKDGVEYDMEDAGVVRGTYRYTAVGMSKITRDGASVEVAPDQKGGIRDGSLLKVTDASDGGHTDTLFDTANLQPWFTKAFAYDPQDRNTGVDTANDDGTSIQKAFAVDGTKPWSSETASKDADGNVRTVEDVFANGTTAIKYLDPRNTHPYTELEVDEDAAGKITAAKPKIDGQPAGNNVDFSAVGQVLGSALGRALAPNNQFVQIAAGTVVGAVGQKLAQAFVASLTTDAASVNLTNVFADFNVSIAGAGASSVASFLVAELGTALHLDGFGAQLFNAGAGGFAGSVASQIATNMAHGASFDVAIGGIQWANAASSAAYSISSLLGSYLGHELVPAQTHEGAVGGQLLGAVGSAVGISIALSNVLGNILGGVLNFIVPGIGSLVGTVLGTLIGDHFGHIPHPAAIDLVDQAGYLYGSSHYQVSEGGSYNSPDQMAAAADAIINAYLTAVKGAALDHSKQTWVGYVTDPNFRYINGEVPTHKYLSFISPDDAVHAAALDVLQNIEVIGGDLLLKRAHHNSPSNIPDPGPEWNGLTAASSQSGAEKLVIMSADLSVAQDYENYLNNREAINALIAATHVRRRAGRAHPRAGSRVHRQRHRMLRRFAVTANRELARPKLWAAIR